MRHIRAHFDYISRNGQLAMEGPDGDVYVGKQEVRWLGDECLRLALAMLGLLVGGFLLYALGYVIFYKLLVR
jgi:hypothetical protein